MIALGCLIWQNNMCHDKPSWIKAAADFHQCTGGRLHRTDVVNVICQIKKQFKDARHLSPSYIWANWTVYAACECICVYVHLDYARIVCGYVSRIWEESV